MTATFTTTVTADLSDRFATRIRVDFSYNREDVVAIKTVPGARFVGKDDLKGESELPYWTCPKDLISARALRDAFGKRLQLTERLAEWGWMENRRNSMLGTLASAVDAELENLPMALPKVADALRPYQRAGVKFLSVNGGLIADQPGLGKTIQTIGALAEAELMDDPEGGKAFLVIAPSTSLESTWKKELQQWQDFEVFVAMGSRAQRTAIIEDFREHLEFGGNGWLVVNPAMVRYGTSWNSERCIEHDDADRAAEKRGCAYCIRIETREYAEFDELSWDAVVIDESHDVVRNPATLTAKGVFKLNENEGCKRIAMTGTPIMNLPLDLWAALHWLNPETFSSKWQWAGRFMEIKENEYGKTIGDLRDEMQEEFFESLKPYVLRRTKAEVAKDLPPKSHVHVSLPFANEAHRKQYVQFQNEAFIKIADLELGATGVLDELTRLRQFAIALCDVNENPKGDGHPIVVQQTSVSAKVNWIDEHLMELGILGHDGKAAGSKERTVIFSQFTRVLSMLKDHYEAKGIRCGEISGRVAMGKRREVIADFQDTDSDMNIILISTKAGGVSIELDAADEVIFLDETWNYGLMEQAEDRVHRANKGRTKPVTIYVLRTEDTVETETVMPKVAGKKEMANFIMDVRRGVTEAVAA